MVFLKSVASVFLAVVLIFTSACTNVIFQPSHEQFIDPGQIGVPVDELFIKSGDAVLHGWHLPASAPIRGTVLFLHGNGQNVSAHLGATYWLPKHGFEVYMFDYRGYGQSTGTPDIDGVQKDAGNMLAWTARESCLHGHKLTVLGHSFGASLAIYATASYPQKQRLNGLISVSAFSDYREISRDALSRHWFTRLFKWPLSLTISNRYRPAAFISEISPLPVYILHSPDDTIVPAYHVDKLFAAALPPKYRVDLVGDHNDAFNPESNRRKLLDILHTLGKRTGACT
ncbi:hypothetical protein DFR30_1170 [Thiogranum longum]|uniref:Serine aminopeptidase S33 domain-containing protein n=1 Tax=Thiogranum longum TaxID=1537524 RepID=A0A4V2PGS0_9GAMM|nr:alpha/beta hydrolase [Thiogranum longum]TCK17916.1 hypothetical protein DFR30_1170 [Thiogranum longum]